MVAKPRRSVVSAQDRLAGLFEPDVLLPAQFFAAFRRIGRFDRERLLMLAVLEDAVDCYQKHAFSKDPRGQQLFDEAEEWVGSDDKGWLFSFENICDTLEIAPDYVRRGLVGWREREQHHSRDTATHLPTDGAMAGARPVSAPLQKATA